MSVLWPCEVQFEHLLLFFCCRCSVYIHVYTNGELLLHSFVSFRCYESPLQGQEAVSLMFPVKSQCNGIVSYRHRLMNVAFDEMG
jgi:hypothetical protein